MTSYSVWAPPRGDIAETAVFVAQKFSWGAFVFTVFWALWHRHLLLAVALFFALGLVQGLILMAGGHPVLGSLLPNLFGFWLGLEAGPLRNWLYQRRGFRDLGEVLAADDEEAELRFFAAFAPAPAPAPRPIVAGSSSDLLGLFTPGNA